MEQNCRVVFLDWLRLIACFMVILVHCIEPFYYGGTGGLYIDTYSDACWVTLLNTPLRAAVPLFILTSSYLLVPVKTDLKTFIKKRLMRVLIPFLVWSILYAVVPIPGSGCSVDVAGNLKSLMFNFVMTSSGHMWFVYMLLGIYLLMPIVSPWLERLFCGYGHSLLFFHYFNLLLKRLQEVAIFGESANGTHSEHSIM